MTLRDSAAVALGHRGLQHGIGLLADRRIRHQIVVPPVEVHRIECVGGNELLDFDRLVVLRAQLLDFVRIDDRVLALCVFVAQDDLVLAHLTMNGADFLILNPAIADRVQLVEVNLAAARSRGIEGLNGHRDEAQLQITFPTRTHRHGRFLGTGGRDLCG